MAGKKGVVIICNLDTRGEDIVFVKDLITSRGLEPILLDFSMEEPPPFPGEQIEAVIALVKDIAARWNIPPQNTNPVPRPLSHPVGSTGCPHSRA